MPTLLRTRPLPLQVLLAGVVPIAFGALCGWLLTVNKTAYLIASLLAIAGGYVAGQEHDGAGEGALRGLIGFLGAAILAFSVFALPWFSTSCANGKEATVAAKQVGGCNPKSKIKLAN